MTLAKDSRVTMEYVYLMTTSVTALMIVMMTVTKKTAVHRNTRVKQVTCKYSFLEEHGCYIITSVKIIKNVEGCRDDEED